MRPPLRALAIAAALASLAVACRGAPPSADTPATTVLGTVDTLRRDRVGAYGGSVPTPAMDALAARGTRFTDARTPVPLTLPAHVTMLTGLAPAGHGVRSNSASRVPPPKERGFGLLAEALSA